MYKVFRLLLLLLTKPHKGFKAKGRDAPETRGIFYNGRNPTSASDDKWQHHPSPPPYFLYVSDRGGKFFSSDKTHGELLMTNHGTFRSTDFMSTYTPCTW